MTSFTNHRRCCSRRPGARQGSIYIVTMMTALIVSTMAVAALMTVRVQRRQALDADHMRQAQLHAESALQLAKYHMRTDSAWRTKLNSGTWASNVPIGSGFYTFTGTDPIDGNLLNGSHDPVIITATGKQADCTYSLSGRFEFTQPGISCLRSTAHSSLDLTVSGATVTSVEGPLATNSNLTLGPPSVVTGNCEATGIVTKDPAATLNGTSTNGVAAKVMPVASDVLTHYQSIGTAIPKSSLPLWEREYLQNPGAETGVIAPWVASNCSVSISTAVKQSGTRSFYVYNRTVLLDGVKQDIAPQLAQNISYKIKGGVYVDSLINVDSFRLHLLLKTTAGDVSYTSGWYSASVGTWVGMSFTTALNWSGTLNNAYLFVQSSVGLTPFYFDDMSITEASAKSNTYVIHRKLLSAQSNPFTGILNSQGVYVVDCQGDKFSMMDCRVKGTLVLLNAHSSSMIEGSINWEPHTGFSTNPSVPNLPALVLDTAIEISMSGTDLRESIANVNFNPPGTPFRGSTDTDLTDTYVSQIVGIVFNKQLLTLSNRANVFGSVISTDKIDFKSPTSSVTLIHQPLYLLVNPPIGFRTSAPAFSLLPGSVEQLVQ